jgi:hypothetical protein
MHLLVCLLEVKDEKIGLEEEDYPALRYRVLPGLRRQFKEPDIFPTTITNYFNN